jgi:hypothetical protein
MRNYLSIAAAWLLGLALAISASAHEHGYLPPAYTMHNSGQVYLLPYPVPAAQGMSLPATTYAYGWFGVVPRCHKSCHYGYYNNYHECRQR